MSYKPCQLVDCLVKETPIWCVCKYIYFLQTDLLQEMATLLFQCYEKVVWERGALLAATKTFYL